MQINTYIYGTSFYHKFDIRAKLLFTLLISISVFFCQRVFVLTAVAFLFIAVSIVSVGVKETWFGFKRLALILFFLFLFAPLQKRASVEGIYIGSFKLVTYASLLTSYLVAMRFISISYAFMLLIETEKSERIIDAFEWYKLPGNVSLMLSLVLRYIPYIGSMYEEIRLSMSLRLKEGKRGYPIFPTIIALTVASIKMIPQTASSLEERGYGSGEAIKRNRFNKSKSLLIDFAICIILPLFILLGGRVW